MDHYFLPVLDVMYCLVREAGTHILFILFNWQIVLSAGRTPQMDRKYSLNCFMHGYSETQF